MRLWKGGVTMSANKARGSGGLVLRPLSQRRADQFSGEGRERPLDGALDVPIEQVERDPDQPRQDWDHDEGQRQLEELTASVREFGILQPLLVREEGALADGRLRYVITAGARRRVAAERAGLTRVPVVVRGTEGARVRILQLEENIHRQQISPLDEGRAYQELLDAEGFTPEQLAERVHKSGQHIRGRLRLLTDQVIADAVQRRQIPVEAARLLQQLPDDEAETLKARIVAGERVATADLTAIRQRLRAAGIVNPRYKGGGRRARQDQGRPSSPGDGASAAAAAASTGSGAADQWPIDRPGASGTVPNASPAHPDQWPIDPAAPDRMSTVTDMGVTGDDVRASSPAHPAAMAAWGEYIAALFLELLRSRPPRGEEMIEALQGWRPGDVVPDWWIAIFHALHRRVTPSE